MSDDEALRRRLRAVERSLTDGEHEVDGLRERGALVDRIETLESQLADAEDRITDLEATTQALRGYVGNVRSVNEDVERRADAALAAIERLEDRLDDGIGRSADGSGRPKRPSEPAGIRTTNSAARPGTSDDRAGDGGASDGRDDDNEDGLVARVRNAF